jgi:hypothetical protein
MVLCPRLRGEVSLASRAAAMRDEGGNPKILDITAGRTHTPPP